MQRRVLGKSGVEVPVIGLGAGHLGRPEQSDAEVERLLDRAVELGVTLIDTAPSYGASEERIGRWLSARPGRALLSTKCGYGVPGHEDWTPGCIREGVDLALRRLRVDTVDLLHFHSCPREVLERPGVVDALVAAQRAGKVRVAAYSGEGEALTWAIESGAFGAVQCSVSLFDQANAASALPLAQAKGLGVLAKRPLANAPWRFADRPPAQDVATYWDRMRAMGLTEPEDGWQTLAVRFALQVSGVSALLAGTSRAEHLEAVVRAAELGPLPTSRFEELRRAFERAGREWAGVI